jgi:hypothetical protein
MHGGGSTDGTMLVIRFATPMEEYAEYAKNIMNISDDIYEPVVAKKN